MEFSLKPGALKRALSLVKPFVMRSATKRVFTCVRIRRASPYAIELAGTDLEFAAVVECEAVVETAVGAWATVVVPFDQLAKLAALKSPGIAFTRDGLNLRAQWIGASGTVCKRMVEGEDPEQYPDLPESPGKIYSAAGSLSDAIFDALPFAGAEAARYVLNGVQITAEGVCATDGRRMYWEPSALAPNSIQMLEKFTRPDRIVPDRGGRIRGVARPDQVVGRQKGAIQVAQSVRVIHMSHIV